MQIAQDAHYEFVSHGGGGGAGGGDAIETGGGCEGRGG